jgi:hypothetical protein
MGVLSKINRARKKATKKITKPFIKAASKISQKFIPNELRFLAPYAAGIGTLMLPPGMGPLARAFAGAGLNSLGQIASNESEVDDLSDLNALSIALAGGMGALGSDKVSGAMRGGIETNPELAMTGADAGEYIASGQNVPGTTGFLQGAENIGREGIASLSDVVTGGRQDLVGLGSNPEKLFTLGGAKDAAKALGPALTQGSGDVAYEAAVDLKNEQDALDAQESADIEKTTTANQSERAGLQMTMMRQAGVPEETVEETLSMNDLSEYYVPPQSAAYGGLMGRNNYEFGGITEALMNAGSRGLMTQNRAMGGMMGNDKTYHQYHDQTVPMDMESMMGYNMGGSVLPRGMEMDYRGGGFIPMGSKERADDVPARVSKNEFVMTADAVRAAGGGSVNQGAKKMYDLMNNLEARA